MTLAALSRMPFHTLPRSRYSPGLLARVAAGWQRIADEERRGVASAAHIAAELAALNAPPALLAAAARVIADEVHHLDVCACVLDELGPGRRGGPVRSESARRLDLVPRATLGEAALARTLVADYALGKPASAAAFAAARALSREPLFAWAYTELLHDEARHATFGAKTAAWVIRRWTGRERRALWTQALTASAAAASATATFRPHDEEAQSLGLLPASSDCTLPRWILPHLAPLGIRTSAANETELLH
jgi:hypothetical protein